MKAEALVVNLAEFDPHGLRIVANQDDIRRDMHIFLQYVSSREVKRTHRNNEIPKADLLRIGKMIGSETIAEDINSHGNSSWINEIDRFCRLLKFTAYDIEGSYAGYSSSELSYPDNYIDFSQKRFASFLDKSLQQQENEIFSISISETKPCDSEFFSPAARSVLDRFDSRGCATGVLTIIDFPKVRRTLFGVIAAVVPGKWVTVDSLVAYLKRETPFFLIPEKIPKKMLYDNNRYHNFVEREINEYWTNTEITPSCDRAFERVEGRYVERFLEDTPLTLGYVELAYTDTNDFPRAPSLGRLRGFRTTERCRRMLHQEIKAPRVTVLPNFEVHIESLFYPFNVMGSLDLFCDTVTEDVHTILKLSKKKVMASVAQDDGLDVLDILGRISSYPLPSNVKNELDVWSGHASTFTLYSGFGLLEGDDAAKVVEDEVEEKVKAGIQIVRKPQTVYSRLEKAEQVPLLVKHPETKLISLAHDVRSLFARSEKKQKTSKTSKKEQYVIKRTIMATLHFPDADFLYALLKTMLDMGHTVSVNKKERTITYPGKEETIIKEVIKKVNGQLSTNARIEDEKE